MSGNNNNGQNNKGQNRKKNVNQQANTVKGAVDNAQPQEDAEAKRIAAEQKAAEEKQAAEEKAAADKAAAEKKDAEEKASAEKAEADKAAAIKVEQETVRIAGVKTQFDTKLDQYKAICKSRALSDKGLKQKIELFAGLILFVVKSGEQILFDETVEFFRKEARGLMDEKVVFGGISFLGTATRTKVEVFYGLLNLIVKSNGPIKTNVDYVREVLGNDIVICAAKYLKK